MGTGTKKKKVPYDSEQHECECVGVGVWERKPRQTNSKEIEGRRHSQKRRTDQMNKQNVKLSVMWFISNEEWQFMQTCMRQIGKETRCPLLFPQGSAARTHHRFVCVVHCMTSP